MDEHEIEKNKRDIVDVDKLFMSMPLRVLVTSAAHHVKDTHADENETPAKCMQIRNLIGSITHCGQEQILVAHMVLMSLLVNLTEQNPELIATVALVAKEQEDADSDKL